MHLLEHHYGDHIHVLAEPAMLSLLARIGSPDTPPDQMPTLVRAAYTRLTFAALDHHFPVTHRRELTRMSASEPRGFYDGPGLCRNTKLVVCAVIRAGILPAQTVYETACLMMPPSNVRLDFVNMSRTTDTHGHVTGVRLDGSKIGGDVREAVIVVADPMAATGGTTERVAEIYGGLEGGPPRALVNLHLMMTPESIRRTEEVDVPMDSWTVRIDRGLSSERALAARPGRYPDEERGLNDIQYIVPGAGGMGELLTNSWV